MEWSDTRKTLLTALRPPPPVLVSCPRRIYWEAARYTVDGVYDDTAYSINSFARYIAELQNYDRVVPYIEEILIVTVLWRGHFPVTIFGKTIKLPLHSITAFSWGLLICWDFNLFPAFLFFAIGWIFLTANGILRRNPSKWHTPRSYIQLWSIVLFGRIFAAEIHPNQDMDAIRAFDQAEKERQRRRKRTQELRAEYEEELRKELGREMDEAEAGVEEIATKAAESVMDQLKVRPLKPILHPIQLKLRIVVNAFRFGSKFFLWQETYYSFWLTTFSFVGCFAAIWVPWGKVVRLIIRVVVIGMLGPW